jgi:transposase InsO family protein
MGAIPAELPFDVQLALFEHYYNHHRPHLALKGKTPAEVWSAANANYPD